VPNAEDRSVRVPDNDRYWLSFGATYPPSPASRLDFGYTFVGIEDADINNDQSARARGIVRGTYEASVHILSVQYQHSFRRSAIPGAGVVPSRHCCGPSPCRAPSACALARQRPEARRRARRLRSWPRPP
jgi:hypothetical protein